MKNYCENPEHKNDPDWHYIKNKCPYCRIAELEEKILHEIDVDQVRIDLEVRIQELEQQLIDGSDKARRVADQAYTDGYKMGEQPLEELLNDRMEWLCERCNTIHPNTTKNGRVYQPCPDCGDAMLPTSFNLRKIKSLRQQNAKLVEALEIIAGRKQCVDNLMSNQEIAAAALKEMGVKGV